MITKRFLKPSSCRQRYERRIYESVALIHQRKSGVYLFGDARLLRMNGLLGVIVKPSQDAGRAQPSLNTYMKRYAGREANRCAGEWHAAGVDCQVLALNNNDGEAKDRRLWIGWENRWYVTCSDGTRRNIVDSGAIRGIRQNPAMGGLDLRKHLWVWFMAA